MRRASIALTVALAAVAGRAAVSARPITRHAYVTVLDAKNAPVANLTAADFAVTLDGTAQEVLSANRATDPLAITLLTDRLGLNATYTQFEIGQALRSFVKIIRGASPDHKFSLMTFDGPVIEVAAFGTPPADLDRQLGRLNTMATDASITDALVGATQSMTKGAPSPRRAIFTVFAAYRPDVSNTRNDTITEVLRRSGASLWAIEARSAQGGNY